MTTSDPQAHMAGSEVLVGLAKEVRAMWDGGEPARGYERSGVPVRALWPVGAMR
ncbi:hypothetical protein AB0I22_10680 [Streptomyces sp. NPDC050610]|uniref:hypothetical protein n=1 Tax=Streptomyces sp. NPDC050610 TaxID=3157097 RepID=UPI0034462D25